MIKILRGLKSETSNMTEPERSKFIIHHKDSEVVSLFELQKMINQNLLGDNTIISMFPPISYKKK